MFSSRETDHQRWRVTISAAKSLSSVVGAVLFVLATGCSRPLAGDDSCAASTPDDLRGFARQGVVTGCAIEIRNTQLTTLEDLRGLRSANAILMVANPQLADISAVSTLDSLRVLSMKDTPAGGQLDATPVTSEIDIDNSAITSLKSTVASLAIIDLRNSADLAALDFGSLTSLDTLTLENDNALDLHQAFASLTKAKSISVTNCLSVASSDLSDLAQRSGATLTHCGNSDDDACGTTETFP